MKVFITETNIMYFCVMEKVFGCKFNTLFPISKIMYFVVSISIENWLICNR